MNRSEDGAGRPSAIAASRCLLVSTLLAALLALGPGDATAARGLTTGFADPLFTAAEAGSRHQALDRTVDARAGLVRINVLWSSVATAQPADPRDPADPAYDFSSYDTAILDATQRGLDVLLTIYRAPAWAEGAGRPAGTPAGSWRPQPAAFADFGHAIATRYSGSFPAASPLPRVRLYQAWNEPNLSTYLNPQYEGEQSLSAGVYTPMIDAFYDAIKGVHRDNLVITAGTAPYGDPPGGRRTRPLVFWREALAARFDVLAHHPINTSGGPRRSAIHRDDVSTPDLHHLRRLLRAAERRGVTGTPGRHRIWVTEIWWESDPPDGFEGVSLGRHARYLEEALYLLWKQGARVVLNLQVSDSVFDQANPLLDTATGLFFHDGRAKPAFTAYRFPFVADRRSKRRVLAWGKAPAGGRVRIERRAGRGWRRIGGARVRAGKVFKEKLRLRDRANLRARVAGQKSLTWKQKG
ncbi:MAG: cellulase family glycosylhydrolase [Solirubrobacterales bacterium]